jgi:hypothetical protein
MHLRGDFLIFLIACLYCAAHAACPADSHTEQGLRKVEDRWLQALISKDRATLDCILSSDFTDSSIKGELRTRAEVLGSLDRPRDYIQKLAIDRVTVKGDTGVVAGKNIITGAAGNHLLEIRFTDTFIYQDGRWMALAAQETRIQQ